MAVNLSSYRSGPPRYGTRENKERLNSDVKTYTLPPEELERYRKGEVKGMVKGDLDEAKRLIKETDLSSSEIVKRTGASINTVQKYYQDMRKEKNIPKKHVGPKAQTELIEQLKNQRDKALAELEAMTNSHEELKLNYSNLESQITNLEGKVIQLEGDLEVAHLDSKRLSEERTQSVPVEDDKDRRIRQLTEMNDYLHQENLGLRIRARTFKETIREILSETVK